MRAYTGSEALTIHGETQFLHHHLQVFPGFALLAGITEKIRRMVGHGELTTAPVRIVALHARGLEIVEAAAELRHGGVHGEQRLGGDSTKSDDDLRLDDRDLAHQERRTGFALLT